jgi:hypothetical protein
MIQFLESAAQIRDALRTSISRHGSDRPIRIAVAFWGAGAEQLIEEAGDRRFEIICNLASGGTNPAVIDHLRNLPNVTIRQMDRLHAKVAVTDRAAIVSSANLSANGLGLEGETASTWSEAGTLIEATSGEYQRVNAWFTRQWALARNISDADIEAAAAAWEKRPQIQDEVPPAEEPQGPITFRTLEYSGRAPMAKVYLRTAATIVALNGCDGTAMPKAAFAFLAGRRALDHQSGAGRLTQNGSTVRLSEDGIGYFIGHDGTRETMPKDRLKRFSNEDVSDYARWMRGEDCLPAHLIGTGTVSEAQFEL